MKRNLIVMAVGVVLMSVLLAIAVYRKVYPFHPAPGLAKGQMAPEFILTDTQGHAVKLSELRGKAVVLNFWATWCPPCKEEIPWFVDVQTRYAAQGVQVIGVSMDDARDHDDVIKFAAEQHINYPILFGQETVAQRYGGVDYLPTTYYIDRDGVVVERVFGQPGDRKEIDQAVQQLLSARPPREQPAANGLH